jgi:hypothetical protein
VEFANHSSGVGPVDRTGMKFMQSMRGAAYFTGTISTILFYSEDMMKKLIGRAIQFQFLNQLVDFIEKIFRSPNP